MLMKERKKNKYLTQTMKKVVRMSTPATRTDVNTWSKRKADGMRFLVVCKSPAQNIHS